MLGYNDDPDATRRAIDADGWLHTGDLGTMDARGYVRVTGRVKEMIIRGGENLFPAEIENVLLEHPDVAEVAVVGVPDERWGEIVACFVRLAAGARLDRRRAARPLPRPPGAAEDAGALDRGRRVAADRLGQDPEVRAARPLRRRGVRASVKPPSPPRSGGYGQG